MSKPLRGLSAEGANELPQARHRTTLRIAVGVMRGPMFALLIGAKWNDGDLLGTENEAR